MTEKDQEDLATLDALIEQEIRNVLERHPIPDVPSLPPADQENEETPLDQESWFKKKGIVATFESPLLGGVSRVLYDSGTLGYASSEYADMYDKPFNEVEGYRILDALIENIVKEFGEGPVYVKAQCHPSNHGPFSQDFSNNGGSGKDRHIVKVVDRSDAFGGGDQPTGWYSVGEYRYESFRILMDSWDEWGGDDVFELDRALKSQSFAYQQSQIVEGSADEQYRMY